MPRWLKLVAWAALGLTLLCGVGVGGVVWWFKANAERLRDDGQRRIAEGQAFARDTDADGCVNEALARLDVADGFVAQAELKVFLRACLEHTLHRPDFCEGLPRLSELVPAASWSVANCNARGARDTKACGRLMQAVLEFCEQEDQGRDRPRTE